MNYKRLSRIFFCTGLWILLYNHSFSQTQKKIATEPPTSLTNLSTVPKDLSYLVKKIKFDKDLLFYSPKNYYIADIRDSTSTKDSIGKAILPGSFKVIRIAFAGKKDSIIKGFYQTGLKKDSTLPAVIVKINSFSINEEKIDKATVDVAMKYRFEILCVNQGEEFSLDEYGGSFNNHHYIGGIRPYDSIVKMIIKDLPKRIDELMERAVAQHPKFSRGFQYKVNIASNNAEKTDSVFINRNSFLNWDDYKDKALYEDEIYSAYGLYLELSDIEYKNRYYDVEITIKPAFIRSKSWVGNKVKDSRLLRHESYRGQLVYLYALKLKQKIETQILSIENFKDVLDKAYYSMEDEFRKEMLRYDKETQHGIKTKIQTDWESQIDQEIEKIKT